MQRNWIGKSEVLKLNLLLMEKIKNKSIHHKAKHYFGASFIVLAPEHPYLLDLATDSTREALEEYKQTSLKKSEIERQENKEKQVSLQEAMLSIRLVAKKCQFGQVIMY